MKVVKVSEIIRILKKDGWYLAHQKGIPPGACSQHAQVWQQAAVSVWPLYRKRKNNDIWKR